MQVTLSLGTEMSHSARAHGSGVVGYPLLSAIVAWGAVTLTAVWAEEGAMAV